MVQISSTHFGTLSLVAEVPAGFKGTLLPGGKVFHYSGNIGDIVLQERVSNQYTIKYNQLLFHETSDWIMDAGTNGILSLVSLRETFKARLKEVGKIIVRENQFTLLQTEAVEMTFVFEKGKKYYAFEIWFNRELLNQFLAYFKKLHATLIKFASRRSFVISKSKYLGKVASSIIQDILRCPYEDDLQDLYFESKVKEYLLVLLAETYKEQTPAEILTSRQQDAIYKARSIILSDITNHFSIQDIAKQVGLNEFSLKAGFRETFGTGMFECLLSARMEKAKELVTATNEPIKAIASISGYSNTTNFITAFRKRFGYTPGSLRRT